ncbi:hypothetical protein BJP08_10875 [Corynebacterium sp. NML140438]|uniref:hypothetical protein n=1 Tax=Corynebacterium sp. NML140438 TaxID=1906334 RepID=UPI0008FB84E5|nr:hypothetical protein [Corynebacterium sp. NML140438]OIR40438.1 hypothetical protein BJP08_10875 [Corynebacterium sp. NML140438]
MQRATRLGVVTLATTLALAGMAAPSNATTLSSVRFTPSIVVNQGDVVEVGIAKCQVGYVDAVSKTAYVARHCFTQGPGELLYKNSQAVGFSTRAGLIDARFKNDDVMAVRLYADVTAGQNPFSGDTIADYDSLESGMKVCANSVRQRKVVCGHTQGAGDGVIKVEADETLIRGDSGGPAWLVDAAGNSLGFVGVISQTSTVEAPPSKTWYEWKVTSVTNKSCKASTEVPTYLTAKPGSCGIHDDAPGRLSPLTQMRPPGQPWTRRVADEFEVLSSKIKSGDPLSRQQEDMVLGLTLSIVIGLAGLGVYGAYLLGEPVIARFVDGLKRLPVTEQFGWKED